jgi:Concanavalin A-like lectin/glucanases superfamily
MASAAKSQSAMEYLMTYGWSILIVAVVLAALFQLGVFSSVNFTPRAQPGNCRVLRVAGTANLEGTCTGVPPQSVAMFDGVSSYIDAGNAPGLSPTTAITIELWIKMNTLPTVSGGIVSKGGAGGNTPYGPYSLWYSGSSGVIIFEVGNGIVRNTGPQVSQDPGVFEQWVAVYSAPNTLLYKNGALAAGPINTGFSSLVVNTNHLFIGDSIGSLGYFTGSIADIQIYNTSLDQSQITALYLRGIGAAPIDPSHIVSWWPLNGDANDYSGNNNNGAPTNAVFTGSWMSGYTPP